MAAKDVKKPRERSPRMIAAIARAQRILRVLIPLAIGTLLLALGLFFAWQAWLVNNQERGAEEADQLRSNAITAIGAELRRTLQNVQVALADQTVLDALDEGGQQGREAAAVALAQVLPNLSRSRVLFAGTRRNSGGRSRQVRLCEGADADAGAGACGAGADPGAFRKRQGSRVW